MCFVAGSDDHLIRSVAGTGVRGLFPKIFGPGNMPPAGKAAEDEVLPRGPKS